MRPLITLVVFGGGIATACGGSGTGLPFNAEQARAQLEADQVPAGQVEEAFDTTRKACQEPDDERFVSLVVFAVNMDDDRPFKALSAGCSQRVADALDIIYDD